MDISRMAAEPHLEAQTADAPKKPGPRPGSRHSGMFRPGFDERRRGSQVRKDFMQLVRDSADDALECLLDCINDEDAPWKERRAASELIIAHAVGTPVSRVLQANITPGGNTDYSALSNEELVNLALTASPDASEHLEGHIDGDFATVYDTVDN